MIKFRIPYKHRIMKETFTAKELFDDICSQAGVVVGSTSFVNSNYTILGNAYTNNETCETVLKDLAKLAAGFAKIGRDNKCYIKNLEVSENYDEVIDGNHYKESFTKTGEYGVVNKVTVGLADIEGESNSLKDENSINQNGLTEITINNIAFLINEVERLKVIPAMWDALKGLKYLSAEYDYKGFSYIDSGDKIKLSDVNDLEYNSYIFNHTFTYNGNFSGKISTPMLSKVQEKVSQNSNNVKNAFKNVEYKIDKINGKITQVVEEQTDFSSRLTQQEQTVDSITQKVESMQDFVRETTDMQQLHLTNTAEKESNLILNLTIYGDTEKFKVLTPAEDLVPSEDLVPYGDTIELIVDNQARINPSENAKTFEIAIEEPLRNVGEVKDELNIIDSRASIVRKIGCFYAESTNIFERKRVNSNGTLSTKQDNYLLSDYMKVEDLKQYDISFDYDENNRFNFYQIAYYDENKNYLGQESITGINTTFSTIQNTQYVRVGLRYLEEWAVDGIPNNFQLIEHGRTNGELYILNKELIEDLGEIKLPTFNENTYIYIKEYPDLDYYCKYIINNEYVDVFLPRVEFGTELIQNAEAFKYVWNQLSQYIQLEGINGKATLNIYDENNNILMSIDDTGQNFYSEHDDKSFGKTGVSEVIDEYDDTKNAKYVAFSVKGDYGETIKNGMAWGITTESDNKFYPILYIKDFTIPPKNSGGCTGQLVLDGCDLVIGSENSGIVSNGLRITADVIPRSFLYRRRNKYKFT